MSNTTTYDQLIFKASHNSYDRKESLDQQLTFYPNDPSKCGCLGIELDIWRHTSAYVPYESMDKGFFTVAHITPGSTTLASYFDQILKWNKANPGHYPVLVTIDIKSSGGGFDHFDVEIDTYLKLYFGEALIFKPNNLLYDESLSLCENVVNQGWPTIDSEEMKGKFIFCLSGNKDWKAEYARTNLPIRYCFSDEDKSDSDPKVTPPTTGNIVFFNFGISNSNRGVWMNTIPLFAPKHLITRTYVSNDETIWNNCIKANVSAIATNKISDYSWCKVSNTSPYAIKAVAFDKRSLKNNGNNEFRTSNATEMQPTYESPRCTFLFEAYTENNETVYALRNAQNSEYLDCTITTMSSSVNDNCQKWRLIPVNVDKNEYYIQNVKNNEYMTKRASKLSDSAGKDEVYTIEQR